MDLSVVIVNYNVRYFLEQCLHSVYKGMEHLQGEVFVVDNNSVDGSCAMIREKFPQVRLIENKDNKGFSQANNQALKLASGKYCLLLNPDTVVEEDTFQKCIRFMDSNPDAGALGVKMINGKGKYLPESKRSLPRPIVAFCKIFGLSAIFPHSKLFGRYHLSFLNKDETHAIEILSGAFMFIRSQALEKTGLLDERFFMYGEDIDLSYRLTLAGYKNYYFPETTIIHYKGESTKKGSINYVLVFYRAMILFAHKHFSRQNAWILTIMINFAIYFRAFLAISRRIVKSIYQPVLDIIFIYSGFYFLTPLWEIYKFGNEGYYPYEFYYFAVPSYILIWIISVFFSGGYEKPIRIWKLLTGFLTGTLIILIIYGLLPEDLRFSRALILFGACWGLIALPLHRLLLHLADFKDYELASNRKMRVIIVGLKEEASRIEKLLRKNHKVPDIIGYILPVGLENPEYLGNTSQLLEIIKIHKVDEIIFCAHDISSREIILAMTSVSMLPVEFKIAPPESISIIGSSSIKSTGDIYNIFFNSIGKPKNIRKKKLFDVVSSLIIIIIFPFLYILTKDFKTFRNAIRVLMGNNTWVSYFHDSDISKLPNLKRGIYQPANNYQMFDIEAIDNINIEYAKDYKIYTDIVILTKNIFKN